MFYGFSEFFSGKQGRKRHSPSLESEAAPSRGLAELHVPAKENDAYRIFRRVVRPRKILYASFSVAVVWRPTGGHSLITRKVSDLGGGSAQRANPNKLYLDRKLRARRNF